MTSFIELKGRAEPNDMKIILSPAQRMGKEVCLLKNCYKRQRNKITRFIIKGDVLDLTKKYWHFCIIGEIIANCEVRVSKRRNMSAYQCK